MMDTRPKISVIVAVYNAGKYLKRCIDSLQAQTFTDFEVLLIDDGSTDGSGKICDEYAARDRRFRVFHQANGGVASARQKGIDEARGTYSIHVDADDWAGPGMLAGLYAEASREGADMVLCDYYEVADGVPGYKGQRPTELSTDMVIKDILSGRLMGALWNKLIRHGLYTEHGVSFATGINYCEDVLVCVRLLLKGITVAYLPSAYYHYDMGNAASITRNYTEATYAMRKRYIAELQSFLPGTYHRHLEEAALQVKAGAFVHGCLTAGEYRNYFPVSVRRILSSNHSPRIKVAFALANMGMFRAGRWFYKQYSSLTARKGRPYILLWGDCGLNAGPSNVHRSLVTHSGGELHYVKDRPKLLRYIGLIWKSILADVIIYPSFTSSSDVRLMQLMCRKRVCISHGCLKWESVINCNGRDKEKVETGERYAFSSASMIVCVSKRHMEQLKGAYPEYADKMTYVNNGVQIAPRERKEKRMHTIAVSGGNRNIKNNAYVCRAVQKLNEAGYPCSVSIFGRLYPDGEDLSRYPHAHYMGQLDKEAYYSHLDTIELFVVASEMETFGLVIADALNCHCSLLMSRNVGAAAIMETIDEDFVDNPHDIDELAMRIRHLLDNPNADRLLQSVDVQSCSEREAWKRMKAICNKI